MITNRSKWTGIFYFQEILKSIKSGLIYFPGSGIIDFVPSVDGYISEDRDSIIFQP